MKQLIEKWRSRKPPLHTEGFTRGSSACASELQDFIDNLWTEITEDEATWPEEGQRVMYLSPARVDLIFFYALYNPNMFECYWRPLLSIDTPD